MTQSMPNLFTPITLGKRTVRNRIVFPPHGTGLGAQGLPSDRHVAYYARRAEGGAGMIIQEATPAHPASLGRPTHVRGYDRAVVAPATKISDAVHKAGAIMLVQVSHRGLAALPMFSGSAVWAPSATRSPHTGEMTHALTRSEIKEVVAGFVQTARNFMDAGYDGVEVHAAHGHLLQAFSSPQTNLRRDAYGGSVENRWRLHIEVLEALRKLPLGVLGIRVGLPAWSSPSDPGDAPVIIRMIEPYVDYISASTGGTQATVHITVGDLYAQPGYMLDFARQVKKMTSRPVIAAGRLHEPMLAASVLEEGSADLIGLCRALISDPDWPRKVERGATREIRHCVACNTCLERLDSGTLIGCIQNPRAGREADLETMVSTTSQVRGKRILVVGGGPAGMQAALRAEELGFRVRLMEANADLGGQVALAASVPGREIFARISDSLEGALARSQVEVVRGKRLAPKDAELSSFDGVIVATGACFGRLPESSAINVPRCRTEEILGDPSIVKGKRALVVIEDGTAAGAGAAELLAARGLEVHVVLAGAEAGGALPRHNRRTLMDRMLALPLHWHFHSALLRVDKSGEATIHSRGEGEVRLAGRFDFVVHGMVRNATTELIDALESNGSPVYVAAGDCVAPRNLFAAIREGFDAADRLASLLA